jgi:diguanylate cyclase (GGDEF)-like protein
LVAVHSDITQRKENEEKLKALTEDLISQKEQLELLATTDSLTGLLNRRSFIDQIENEITRQQRSGKTFTIVMSDIDNFKNLNDSYGHPFGDSVLIKVADTFRADIRDQDFVSRWGGEEFILLLPETNLEGAFVLSEKIRKNLENSEHLFEGKQVTVTATFGISECRAQDNYLESIKKADQALYEGKKAGRNCVMPGYKI